jgi:hypothetical protein
MLTPKSDRGWWRIEIVARSSHPTLYPEVKRTSGFGERSDFPMGEEFGCHLEMTLQSRDCDDIVTWIAV